MEIKVANLCEYKDVIDFYYQLIDNMENDPYSPLWKKNIYPENAAIKRAIENGWLYVMEDNGEIIGSMVINSEYTEGYEKVCWSMEANGEEISVIHLLGIAKSARGKGAGSRLVQGAIDICRSMGKKTIRLDAVGQNKPAQHLYEKMGFSNRGAMQLYYEDTGLTDFVMYDYIL